MIGILPDNDHPYCMKRGQIKSIEDQASGRIHCESLLLTDKKFFNAFKIGGIELLQQDLLPAFFYLWIHLHFFLL